MMMVMMLMMIMMMMTVPKITKSFCLFVKLLNRKSGSFGSHPMAEAFVFTFLI